MFSGVVSDKRENDLQSLALVGVAWIVGHGRRSDE